MKMNQLFYGAVAALFAVICGYSSADAGTVTITNNFSGTIRVAIHAGASESHVTVYAKDMRNYNTFAGKSIDRISVQKVDTGADTQPYIYTVSNPSASTNFSIKVETDGRVSVSIPLLVSPP